MTRSAAAAAAAAGGVTRQAPWWHRRTWHRERHLRACVIGWVVCVGGWVGLAVFSPVHTRVCMPACHCFLPPLYHSSCHPKRHPRRATTKHQPTPAATAATTLRWRVILAPAPCRDCRPAVAVALPLSPCRRTLATTLTNTQGEKNPTRRTARTPHAAHTSNKNYSGWSARLRGLRRTALHFPVLYRCLLSYLLLPRLSTTTPSWWQRVTGLAQAHFFQKRFFPNFMAPHHHRVSCYI